MTSKILQSRFFKLVNGSGFSYPFQMLEFLQDEVSRLQFAVKEGLPIASHLIRVSAHQSSRFIYRQAYNGVFPP